MTYSTKIILIVITYFVFHAAPAQSQNIEYSEHIYYYQGASNSSTLDPVETARRRCLPYGGLVKIDKVGGGVNNHGFPNYYVTCNQFHNPSEIFVSTTCENGWKKANDNCYRFDYTGHSGTDAGPPMCAAGNPVNLANGRKYQMEIDYLSAANPLLKFVRYYNAGTGGRLGEPAKLTRNGFNSSWTHTYSNYLRIQHDPVNVGTRHLTLLRPSGEIEQFSQVGSTITPRTNNDGTDRLIFSNESYLYFVDGKTTEYYDVSGRFIKRVQGRYEVHAVYDVDGRLAGISTPEGHELTFVTSQNTLLVDVGEPTLFEHKSPLLTAIELPDGSQVRFEHNQDVNSIERLALVKVIYPDSSERKYKYTGYHQMLLASIEDEKGIIFAEWTYHSDGSGKAISSNHANDVNRFEYSYSGNDRSVTNPLGLTTNYRMQFRAGKGRLVSTDQEATALCAAADKQYTYDDRGNRLSSTDWNGNVTAYSYNEINQPISMVQAVGTVNARETTTQWHPTFNLPVLIDYPNKTVSFNYDAVGNLTQRTETDTLSGENRVWTYQYDNNFRLISIDGPRNDVNDTFSYTYYNCSIGGRCGQIQSITNALGQTTWYNQYNAHGYPLRITDANGVTTTMTYDMRQRLTSIVIDDNATTIDYEPTGDIRRTTLPDGTFTQYVWDDARRLIALFDGEGNRIEWSLDNAGNRTQERISDPNGIIRKSLQTDFDELSRIHQMIYAHGGVIGYEYDKNSNLSVVTDANDRTSTSEYDALDRLIREINTLSGATQYTHDAHDNLTSVTNPEGLTTTYTYNGFDEVISQTSPDTGTITYTYDQVGNKVTETDARGIISTFTYDAINRLTGVSYPDSSEDVTYTYDQDTFGVGRLSSITDSSGSTSFGYDAQGNITELTQTIDGQRYTQSYTYNGANRLTGMTYPSGRSVTYSYDASGRINRVDSIGNEGSETLADTITRLPFGPLASLILGNSVERQRSYDQDYRIENLNDPDTLSRNYVWSDVNTITAMTDSLASNNSQFFDYDELDRLNFATGSYGERSYSYDGIGNRLTEERSDGTDTYQYFDTNHRLRRLVGERVHTYDAAGNTTRDSARDFTYNQQGRLNSVTRNGDTSTYTHNALGQRVHKTTPTQGTRHFIYDLDGRVIMEADATGTVAVEYAYLDGEPLVMWRDTPSEPAADFEFSSSGSTTDGKWQVFHFEVTAGELIEGNVTWDDPNANVKIFLRDENNTQIANDTDGDSPAMVSATAQTSGTWSIGVSIVSGATDYDVLVNTSSDVTPQEPAADFEFSSSGSTTEGKWQVFQFDVNAGELIEGEVIWDDPDADVRIFLRDENGTQIANDTDGGLPAMVSATAGSSGTWSIGVSIKSGSVNYDVLVNAMTGGQ